MTDEVRAWASVSNGRGAIAAIELDATSRAALDGVLSRICGSSVAAGAFALRDFCGVDEGVVARWSDGHATLMPHGSPEVVDLIMRALEDLGAAPGQRRRPGREAAINEWLWRGASGLAVDVLLGQARVGVDVGLFDDEASAALARLLTPPTVVAVGRANAGKSSLMNALAGRGVAIVSERAGTTRDHVGVETDLAGLTVRWIDTPGVREGRDALESEAARLTQTLLERASLVVSCEDAEAGAVEKGAIDVPGRPVLRVGTRCDRAVASGVDVNTSAATGAGLAELAAAVRERLVPTRLLTAAASGERRWDPAAGPDTLEHVAPAR
jgi:small GTP-binding protein